VVVVATLLTLTLFAYHGIYGIVILFKDGFSAYGFVSVLAGWFLPTPIGRSFVDETAPRSG